MDYLKDFDGWNEKEGTDLRVSRPPYYKEEISGGCQLESTWDLKKMGRMIIL